MPEHRTFLPESELATPIFHPPGSGRVVGVLGDRTTFKVRPEETGGAYAVLEQQIPTGHGPPLHVHRHETELFYILEGEFEFTVANEKVIASAGAFIAGPRNIPHTFRNIGPGEGRLLLTVIPGQFANYFIDVNGVPDRNRETIRTLCARYGVELLG